MRQKNGFYSPILSAELPRIAKDMFRDLTGGRYTLDAKGVAVQEIFNDLASEDGIVRLDAVLRDMSPLSGFFESVESLDDRRTLAGVLAGHLVMRGIPKEVVDACGVDVEDGPRP